METNDLIKLWKQYDQQVEGNWSINQQLLKEVSLGKVKSLLSEFRLQTILEVVTNGLFFIWIMAFFVDHFFTMKYAVPSVFLLMLTGWGLGWAIFKWVVLATLSYDTPVLSAQKRLELFRLYNRWEINLLLVLIPFFWLAFLIVFPMMFLGMDMFELLGVWIWHQFLGAFVVAAIIVWFLKKFPDKKMEKAIDFLNEIREVEEEKD